MAKGQVVVAQLQTPSPALKFPIADTNDLLGGHHSVPTINDRNNIPAQRRRVGMVVYVEADGKEYQLLSTNPATGNTTNAHWKEYAPGVPSNMITTHQKVEEMRYNTAVNRRATTGMSTPTPTDKLTEVLENLQAQIDDKLSTHQTLEDIQIANPSVFTGTAYTTLLSKLQAMDAAIASLNSSATQGIEDVAWNTVPAGHQSTLDAEINYLYTNMNDPTKIMVDSGTATLQKKLNDLTAYRPAIEDIKNSAGTVNLADLLTNSATAADKIMVSSGTTPATQVSLATRLSTIAAAASGIPKMQDIEWDNPAAPTFTPYGGTAAAVGTKLSQNLIQIYGVLEKMNDPTQIVTGVVTSGNTVIQDLTALKTSGAAKVENVTWNAADATAGAAAGDSLKSTIDKIFGDMNDPTKITTGLYASGNKLNTDLAALKTAIEGVTLGTNKVTHAGTFTNFTVAANSTLDTILNAIDTAIGNTSPDLEGLAFSSAYVPGTMKKLSPTASMSFTALLSNIDNAIDSVATTAGATPKVETVEWDAVPTGMSVLTSIAVGQKLDVVIKAIDAKLADMNDPTKITTGKMTAGNTLAQDLDAIKTALSNVSGSVEGTKWAAAYTGTNFNAAANEALNTTLASIDTAIGTAKTVEATKWAAAPASSFTNFTTPVADEALTTTLANIDTAIGNAAATAQAAGAQKQNLLFNVNAPETGVIACEYLTMFKAKIEEIAYYVNSDATKASDIKFYVEVASVTSGMTTKATYVNLLEGAATSAGTGSVLSGTLTGAELVKIVDLASNNYLLDQNTLIRLRIVSIGASDTINAFNVRVKLTECASNVTDVMGKSSSALTS